LGLGVLWIAALAAVYFVSLQYLTTDTVLQNYWRRGFMPLPPWSNFNWFGKSYLLLLDASLGFDFRYLTIISSALALIGGISLLYRNRNIALILILPFGWTLLGSALQKYPLDDRLMLFLAPLFILLISEGLSWIYLFIQRWNGTIAIAIFGCIALLTLGALADNALQNFLAPPMGENIKPVLQYVAENRSPNDIVYVFHGARPSFNYYAPFYGLDAGKVITGTDPPRAQALQQFYNQANQLKGNDRVWVIFSHIVDCGGCTGNKEAFYVKYLSQFGQGENRFQAQGANVYLYDLNP
jgi:hypothetical protein